MSRTGPRFGFRPGGKRHESGTVVIEFALVFAMFFIVMYGIVCYGIIFALKHSLTQAANEGARAAVRDVGSLDQRMDLAGKTAKDALAWLGTRAPVPEVTAVPCPSAFASSCVKVSLKFNYAAAPIIPPLPGLGIVLPDVIEAQATVQLSAVTNYAASK